MQSDSLVVASQRSRGPLASLASWILALGAGALAFPLPAAAQATCTANCSIWPSSTVPGLVDGGPDSSVELGVKFRSDVAGRVSGIRFYKASTNTGTHVANLWSSAGTLLASATFSGETASGWQQVSFPTPVAIAANTVYVASYLCPNGHYSADVGYFTGKGADAAPLHALADGVSGGDGVYAYGSTSSFPSSTWNASNYWVDVVFSSASLSSIAVTPATATVAAGGTQAFTATATYSDGSTSNVTGSASWTSSSTAVATVSASGVATGQGPGTATITATIGAVAGGAQLTVQAAPLAISTTSLPAATLNLAYAATLSATGGTTPYTWSIVTGSLPPGLSLNASTGAIGGTPTASGSYSFTARVTDAAAATASQALSIAVSAAQDSTIWPSTAVPGLVDGGADSSVELGVKFRADSNGFVKGIRFYKASTNTGTHVGNLWTSTGTRLATATFSGETASGWQQVLFSSPVAVTANTVYVASYHANGGHYSADVSYFATAGVDNPPLHALADGVSGGDGVYAYGSTSAFPNQTWRSTNYWVDVIFTSAAPPPDTTPPTVTAFAVPATATTLVVPITTFTATDDVGVTGYLVNENAATPSASASGWSATAPASYTFASAGAKTLYAWAKDLAGNVSASRSAPVTIALGDATPPTVTAFTIPATATSLVVPITTFTATDDVGVTGYLVNESAATPSASASGWSATPPASYTFASGGAKTLYAWAKDLAGNVSASRNASVTITLPTTGPEPTGWYAGDMHVHRSCGGSPEAVSSLYQKMAPNDLAVISLLADMGNAEVQNAVTDLPLVNGQDASVSTPGKIVHWDAEWHWDPIYYQYPHQALGGHVVALGVSESHQIWQEYTAPIFDWAHQAGGIAGFAHMQYLDNAIPNSLTCCTPIEYPVEVALGKSDFISEDVVDTTQSGMNPEAAVQAYYRLLNCGLRPGFAAGTDYPCNSGNDLGSLLTYARVAGGQMTYRNWIDGIARGRTVVSRNGHNEFLNLVVNGTATPGDEVALTSAGSVQVTAQWTAKQSLSGTIEIVQNGVVVASQQASVSAGAPATLTTTVGFPKSGWLAARRMASNGHQVHTAALFVIVNGAPIRASVEDAQFYVQWMDTLLQNTSSGGAWSSLFPTQRAAAQARYQAAKAIYQQIAAEAAGPQLSSIAVTPASATIQAGATQQFVATGTYSDGSTQVLTASATWASSSPATASVSAGLATGVGSGTTTISATVGSVAGSASLTVVPTPLVIGTTSLGDGAQYVAYAASLAASGGTPPYTWSLASGSLPPGLALNATTGAISGTPSTPGTFAFAVRVADAASQTTTQALSIAVAPAPALFVVTASLSGGAQYVAYSALLAAGGGLPPYTWSIAAGLPPGLTLNATNGVISGTPSASGSYAFTVSVTDSWSQTASKDLSITITAAPPLTIATTALPGGTQGTPYSATLAATGGLPPYAWSIPAGLPPGLSLAPTTGVISGAPTAVGAYSFTTQVTDSASTTASATLSITVVPPGNYTLWPSGTVPIVADQGFDNSVELGVQFRADQAGYITGIRFYKSTANTGTHVASLWTSNGTKLASATSSNETSFGWQQVNFATPVAIAANTVYVASYHVNNGHYAADQYYFSGAGWDNPPLHAIADSNGVYRYGSSSVFPNQTWHSENYYVDVVFNPSAPVPSLTSIGLTPASVTLAAGGTQQYAAVASYSDGSTVDVTREATWTSSDTGVAVVSAGGLATAIGSGTVSVTATLNGVSGSASLTVSPPPPPPNEGPGGPILVISSSANQVSRYLAEILRAEGFQEFRAMDISFVSSSTLAGYDLVILGQFALTAAQASMISSWVTGGGNLIAMRPDKQLAGLLGLRDANATLSNGYLLVDTSTAPGSGIVGQTIQFHGTADLYDLAGAQSIATLYSTAAASAGRPAVTLATYGGGQVAAFTYDLARSVVQTRQGNPAWSGQERDGSSPVRSDDLYFGAAAFDPQLDWVDLTKVAIPQADEQQRLLANLIVQMNLGKKPLPRFWYFPSGFKAVVIMTGDDHANGGTAGRFNSFISASPSGCSVADWQCIRGTSYIYRNTPLTNTQAQSYVSQGFEVALHVNTGCADYTSYDDLDSYYAPQLASFASKYTSVPAPSTNRTHCIAWSDFDTQPQVELAHGIRLDTTYYYWPPEWANDRPGFFTGSGIPMRFALRTGQTIDVYQAATQMTDESGQTYPMTIDALLDNAIGSSGYYGAFAANMHTDTAASTESDAIVSSAKARGVPVVSAKQMLTWLDGRNGSAFGSLSWNGSVLGFTVTAPSGARNLRGMLPTQASGLTLATLTRNGTSVAFTAQVVKGIPYAFFPATAGTYQATYR